MNELYITKKIIGKNTHESVFTKNQSPYCLKSRVLRGLITKRQEQYSGVCEIFYIFNMVRVI